MHRLDTSAAVPASFSRLWFPALFTGLYRKLIPGKVPVEMQEVSDGYSSEATGSEAPGSGTVTPREGSRATSKVGGRRRKATRKR